METSRAVVNSSWQILSGLFVPISAELRRYAASPFPLAIQLETMAFVNKSNLAGTTVFVFLLVVAAVGCDSGSEEARLIEGDYETTLFTVESSSGETVDLLSTGASGRVRLNALSNGIKGFFSFPEEVPGVMGRDDSSPEYSRVRFTGTYGYDGNRVRIRPEEFSSDVTDDLQRALLHGDWSYKDGMLRLRGEGFTLKMRKQ